MKFFLPGQASSKWKGSAKIARIITSWGNHLSLCSEHCVWIPGDVGKRLFKLKCGNMRKLCDNIFLGGDDLLSGAVHLHGGWAGGRSCLLQLRFVLLHQNMITSIISSFVTWTVWTPYKDTDLSEAPVGESVDPCCASQAIPPPSDHKGEMTYEPMIPNNPPSNITPLLDQNNQRYLLLSPQSTQSDQILWVFLHQICTSFCCIHYCVFFLYKILTLALVWFMASWYHLRLWASCFCTSMYIECNRVSLSAWPWLWPGLWLWPWPWSGPTTPQAESHRDPAATKARRRWWPAVAAQTTTTGTTKTTTTGTARTCFHPKEAGTVCPHRQKTKTAIATKTQILGQKVQNSWGRFYLRGSIYRL